MNSLPVGIDLSRVPLALNPNGNPPNFVDPSSLDTIVLAVGITLITLSVCLLMLRLFANFKHTGKLGLDDVLCIFGELAGIAYWGVIYSLAREGASRHMWDIPASIVTKSFIKRQFVQQLIAGPALWSVKAAILSLYIRIFDSVRWMRIASYALIMFTGLFYMSKVVIAAAYCLPRNGAPWDQTAFARCGSPVKSAVVIGVFGVVADLIIFILPFPVISKLHLTQPKKFGLFIVFMAVLLTIVTSVASLAYRITVFLGNDPTWNGINVAITR